MWSASFSLITRRVSAEELFSVLTDLNGWQQWDPEILWTRCEATVGVGTPFLLKPKGGPVTKLSVTKYVPPALFEDVAYLPGARMVTRHEFVASEEGLHITITITVTGILSFFWSRVIARPQIEGSEEQVNRLIEKAVHGRA
jgi:hypothetical protein